MRAVDQGKLTDYDILSTTDTDSSVVYELRYCQQLHSRYTQISLSFYTNLPKRLVVKDFKIDYFTRLRLIGDTSQGRGHEDTSRAIMYSRKFVDIS